MSAEERQNHVRFEHMVEAGLNIVKSLWTRVVWPDIVHNWPSGPGYGPAPGADWTSANGASRATRLLSEYALHVPNQNGGNVYRKHTNVLSFIKFANGQEADLLAGQVYGSDKRTWDIGLLWVLITNFWCHPNMKYDPISKTFRSLQPLEVYRAFRNDYWGHHVTVMSTKEFSEICATAAAPYGQLVGIIEGLVTLVARDSIADMDVRRLIYGDILRAVYPADSHPGVDTLVDGCLSAAYPTAALWDRVLGQLRRMETGTPAPIHNKSLLL